MNNPHSCSYYIFLVQKLLEKRKNKYSIEMSREEIKDVFSNKCKIPGYLHWNILKDMENFELIKIIDKFNIEILYKDDDGLGGIDSIQKMSDTMNQIEIAKEMGISQPRVNKILKKSREASYFD